MTLLPPIAVHLFCLAISSLLSALPTRSLTVHPEAVSELRSTLLSASDRLGLGLVSNDQVLAGLVSIDGRPAPASGDGCKEKEISERVVEMLVRVMMWIQWLEVSETSKHDAMLWGHLGH